VWLAYRTPPHIVYRELNGVPAQAISVVMQELPTVLADRIADLARRLQIPDLSPYGLPDPGPGLYTRAKRGEVPILDVGLIDAVKRRRVEPVPEVVGFDGASVRLAGGRELQPDAVIVATGYRRGLEPLVGQLGLLKDNGRPLVHDRQTHQSAPGLRFIGYTNPPGGMFRQIAIDARKIAKAIAAELPTEVPV
jgi:putative flavoprotein involved in K+ transport